jgi:nucleotide-binding universal stress UspA family protein
MPVYRKILLAYDGSVEGRLALREGARLAQICGAEVFLLAVVDISSGMAMGEANVPGLVLAQQEAFEEVLHEGVRRLTSMGFEPKAKLGLGDPAEEIANVAREIGADLVVVGHRQQGALARWWRGSVGMRLVNNLDCSLLVGRLEVADGELMPDEPGTAS